MKRTRQHYVICFVYFAGQPLLQNGIDSRFSAIYGNPYLRTNSSILPPLPPPSTANPAATPAPPPYHAPRNHMNTMANGGVMGSLKNFGTPSSIISGHNGPASVSGSSSNLTASSNTLAATPLANQQSSVGTPSGVAASTAPTTAQSPSGQFILPSNGNVTKKGALATHV